MTAVMIGVDPHKGSHTAVVISAAEEPLGEIRVRASAAQAQQLIAWAADWPDRTWAVEGAAGLGHLLAQQLVAAGERVLDVQPKLASRVRLLQAGDTNKNDPNDALPVAVAALRSRTGRPVAADDCKAVLKVWSKRHRDLARLRNQADCRLHAVLIRHRPGRAPGRGGRLGLVTTAQQVGGSLCLGVLVTVFTAASTSAARHLPAATTAQLGAKVELAHGTATALTGSAVLLALALVVVTVVIRRTPAPTRPDTTTPHDRSPR